MKLNQLIATESDVRAQTDRVLTDAHHALQKNALLSGLRRTYTPLDDEGEKLPDEGTRVQLSATQVIETAAAAITKLLDTTASKEATNASSDAKADVVVDGKPIITGATVPFLLFLQKRLVDLRTFVMALPVLDAANEWTFDSNEGVYRSETTQTTRTKKVPKAFEKAPATKEHPAQVEVFHEDLIVGTWAATKFSGAIPLSRRNELVTRVDQLTAAVKIAREEANTAQVIQMPIGKPVADFLFG